MRAPLAVRLRQPLPLGGLLLACFAAGALTGIAPRWMLAAAGGGVALLLLGTLLARLPGSSAVALLAVAAFDTVALPIGGLTVSKLVGLLVIGWWLLARLQAPERPLPRHPLMLCAVAYLAWAATSLLWSYDRGAAALRVQSLVLLAISALIVADELHSPARLRTLREGAWLVGLASALVGIGQWVSMGGGLADLGADLSQRVVGGIGDPNEYALFQVSLLPFAVASFGAARGWRARLPRLGAVLLILASIGFTQSRSALLALTVVAAVAALLVGGRLVRRRVLVVGAIAALLVGALFFAPTVQRLSGPTTKERRPTLWAVAIAAFRAEPARGVGIGNFAVPAVYFSFEDRMETLRVANKALVAHNAYLETAAELGLPGITAFLALLVTAAGQSLSLARVASRRLALWGTLLASALLAHMVQMIFLSTQYDKVMWFLFGLVVAVAATAPRLAAEEAP